jgi:hypothetical protein
MEIWEKIKSLFSAQSSIPPDARRLAAASEEVLSTSLMRLPPGESGWITFQEARLLFSAMDQDYAFGEMDEAGRSNIASFAAQAEHRSSFSFMPVEGRVYFTRKWPASVG